MGRIVLVATPIGNLGDLSTRAIEALSSADLIAVEDTRVTGKLLSLQGLKKRQVRLDEHAEERKLMEIIAEVQVGATVAIVSDAGTPGISDPGAALVNVAYANEIKVDSIPGPSAVSNALALSGFYAQRYAFLGFLPRKQGAMRAELSPFADSPLTIVIFESPFRVTKTLESLLDLLGNRRACLCREMTKLHQEVRRGPIAELLGSDLPSKGEYTLVIEGKRRVIAENE